MLKPRRNSLVDEVLVAAPVSSFKRARLVFWVLLALIVLSLYAWSGVIRAIGVEIGNNGGWREIVSRLADWQFQQNMGAGHDDRLNEQIRAYEAERQQLQTTLQSLEKLVQGTRMDGWLRTYSAQRLNEDTVGYELLISNPRPGSDAPAGKLAISVSGIDQFDPQHPERALAESAQRFKATQHRIRPPDVAEAIKGKISTRISRFVIVTVTPFDDPAKAEVAIFPISR